MQRRSKRCGRRPGRAASRGAPDVRRHVPPASARGAPVAGPRTGARPRVGQGRAQCRRARCGDREAPAGNSRSCRWAAARRGGERAGVGALPRTAAGGGDDRSHGGHRRVYQRASASRDCGYRRRAGRPRGAALRSGVVSRQQGSGSSSQSRTPRTIGERLQVAVAAYDAARTGTAAEARESGPAGAC